MGSLIFLLNFKIFIDELKKVRGGFYALSALIIPSLIFIKTSADFETYHLPYINYLSDFKIIFGLVNLSNNYTYGHGWLDILGLFSIPYIENKGVSLIAALFLYFFLIYLLDEIILNQSRKIKIFSVLAFTYTLSNFNKVENLGAEAQPTLLLIIIFLNVLKFLDNENSNEIIVKIFFYVFFALILRIGSLIVIPIIIFFLFIKLKEIFFLLKKYFRLSFFILVFFLILISKNFILTGCLAYPIYLSCPGYNVSWANPIENTIERYEFISAITKRWKFYTLEEGNLESELDYYEPMQKNIILSPAEYNKSKLLWINYFFYDHDVKRLLNAFLIVLFSFISFLIFSKNKSNFVNSLILNPKKNNLFYIAILFTNLMWFFLTPQMRYGGYGVIGGSLMFLSTLILSELKIKKEYFIKVSFFLIFISSSFFLYKNTVRILDYIDKRNIGISSLWPIYNEKIINKDYKIKKIDNINLNLIITPNNIIDKPLQCGNLKMLCLPEERLVCISKIRVKKGYYFISNKNKKCLSQFKQNYWQH